MPTNLNALIRYKQIDICLRNRHNPPNIEKLREVCSEALGEYRGIYREISERTIRDDIRVMKSDMLGFNAPIVSEGGYYYYSDPNYSIFNISVSNLELLKEIFQILIQAKELIRSKKLLYVLSELSSLTNIDLPLKVQEEIKEIEKYSPNFSISGKRKDECIFYDHFLHPKIEEIQEDYFIGESYSVSYKLAKIFELL